MFTKSSKKSKSSGGMCQFCSATSTILFAIGVIALLGAIIGVYKAHVLSVGLTFGTVNGSFSLVVLIMSVFLVRKLSADCTCQCALPPKK